MISHQCDGARLNSLARYGKAALMDQFEWDGGKAETNFARHGVTFEMACDAFKDPFAVDWLREIHDHGEDRFAIIGMVANRLLFVAYTMRGVRIRIISVRGAERHERRRYHEENRHTD